MFLLKKSSCAADILTCSDAVDLLTKSLGMPYSVSVITQWPVVLKWLRLCFLMNVSEKIRQMHQQFIEESRLTFSQVTTNESASLHFMKINYIFQLTYIVLSFSS